jgi:hypothetical protein
MANLNDDLINEIYLTVHLCKLGLGGTKNVT